jgi:hypothetical protein
MTECLPAKLAARFWASVDRGAEDACWPWVGPINLGGYGRASGRWTAHRASWALHHGHIPKGMHVCHACDVRYPLGSKENRRCVNPKHLFLGTHQDNMADLKRKGRKRLGRVTGIALRAQLDPTTSRGSNNGRAKLTEEIVPEVRRLAAMGISHGDIGLLFGGLTAQAIRLCVIRGTWRHVP